MAFSNPLKLPPFEIICQNAVNMATTWRQHGVLSEQKKNQPKKERENQSNEHY